MYNSITERPQDRRTRTSLSLAPLGGPTGSGPNDLEAAALVVEPRLARWRDLITKHVGMAPTLAGSGATWFAEGEHGDALAELVDEGAMVIVARTVPMDIAGWRG